MPQVTIKTLPNPEPMRASSYKALFDNDPKNFQPTRILEVRLAWTKCCDGEWLPKRTSSVTLSVEAKNVSANIAGAKVTLSNRLPSVASFHFVVDSKSSKNMNQLSISVGCFYEDDTYLQVGKFSICNDLVATTPFVKSVADPLIFSLPTKFNRIIATKSEAAKNYYASKGKQFQYANLIIRPLLPFPEKIGNVVVGDGWRFDWTLTYDADEELEKNRLTGLKYSLQPPELRSKAKFLYIKTGLTEATSSEKIAQDGVNESFDFPLAIQHKRAITTSDPISGIFDILCNLENKQYMENFGLRNADYHELSTPYALCNWELGVHTVMLTMERLFSTQQFEMALRVARLIIDPTVAGVSSNECWRCPPFRDIAAREPPSARLYRLICKLSTRS